MWAWLYAVRDVLKERRHGDFSVKFDKPGLKHWLSSITYTKMYLEHEETNTE